MLLIGFILSVAEVITGSLLAFSALASLVVTIITVIATQKTSKAKIEIQLASFLSKARIEYEKALDEYADEKNKAIDDNSIKLKYDSKTEMFINAYNELCFKFLSKKVSKKWFNYLYKNEITDLMQPDANFRIIYERNINNYTAIQKCLIKVKKDK